MLTHIIKKGVHFDQQRKLVITNLICSSSATPTPHAHPTPNKQASVVEAGAVKRCVNMDVRAEEGS